MWLCHCNLRELKSEAAKDWRACTSCHHNFKSHVLVGTRHKRLNGLIQYLDSTKHAAIPMGHECLDAGIFRAWLASPDVHNVPGSFFSCLSPGPYFFQSSLHKQFARCWNQTPSGSFILFSPTSALKATASKVASVGFPSCPYSPGIHHAHEHAHRNLGAQLGSLRRTNG